MEKAKAENVGITLVFRMREFQVEEMEKLLKRVENWCEKTADQGGNPCQ